MSGERVARREEGEGWVSFIGVLFALLGAFNALDGIVALAGDAQFREENLFFGDLTFWGLTLLGLGALQLLTAVLILRRNAPLRLQPDLAALLRRRLPDLVAADHRRRRPDHLRALHPRPPLQVAPPAPPWRRWRATPRSPSGSGSQ
jgi:hypothetical protein